MIKYKSIYKEKKLETGHVSNTKSYSLALNYMKQYIQEQGYYILESDWYRIVTVNSKRPDDFDSTIFVLPLYTWEKDMLMTPIEAKNKSLKSKVLELPNVDELQSICNGYYIIKNNIFKFKEEEYIASQLNNYCVVDMSNGEIISVNKDIKRNVKFLKKSKDDLYVRVYNNGSDTNNYDLTYSTSKLNKVNLTPAIPRKSVINKFKNNELKREKIVNDINNGEIINDVYTIWSNVKDKSDEFSLKDYISTIDFHSFNSGFMETFEKFDGYDNLTPNVQQFLKEIESIYKELGSNTRSAFKIKFSNMNRL